MAKPKTKPGKSRPPVVYRGWELRPYADSPDYPRPWPYSGWVGSSGITRLGTSRALRGRDLAMVEKRIDHYLDTGGCPFDLQCADFPRCLRTLQPRLARRKGDETA